MKIRLTKDKEINGKLWKRGWVGGFDESFANQLIAAGEGIKVADDARTFKFEEAQSKLTECIPDTNEIIETEAPQPKTASLTFKKQR